MHIILLWRRKTLAKQGISLGVSLEKILAAKDVATQLTIHRPKRLDCMVSAPLLRLSQI